MAKVTSGLKYTGKKEYSAALKQFICCLLGVWEYQECLCKQHAPAELQQQALYVDAEMKHAFGSGPTKDIVMKKQ